MKGNFRLFVLLAPILLAVDQAVKAWARSATQGVEGHIVTVWPNVFEIKLVFNEGVAFGMFQGFGVVLTPVAVGIAIVATWYSWKHPLDPRLSHVTAALLAAGSVGNLADRLRFGKVTDMFWIRLINFPVFNVADICITIAGTLLVLGTLSDVFRKRDEKPASTESRL